MKIEKLNVSTYSIPSYELKEDNTLEHLKDQTQNITFIRPKMVIVDKESLSKAEKTLDLIEKKTDKTDKDKENIAQLKKILEEGEKDTDKINGITVGDMLTCIQAELEELKASEVVLQKCKELRFWLGK